MPSSTGQPGYRVLTPFRRADGGAAPARRPRLGAARPRSQPAAAGRGGCGPAHRHRPPRRPAGAGPAHRRGARPEGATGWPLVLNFPVAADVEAALGEPVERRILLLDASAARRIRARLAPVDRLPAGTAPRLRDTMVRARIGAARRLRRDEPPATDTHGPTTRDEHTGPDGGPSRPTAVPAARGALLRAARARVLALLRAGRLASGRRHEPGRPARSRASAAAGRPADRRRLAGPTAICCAASGR